MIRESLFIEMISHEQQNDTSFDLYNYIFSYIFIYYTYVYFLNLKRIFLTLSLEKICSADLFILRRNKFKLMFYTIFLLFSVNVFKNITLCKSFATNVMNVRKSVTKIML